MELILLCLVIVPYEGSFVFLVITYLEDVLGQEIDNLEFGTFILFFFSSVLPSSSVNRR